MLNLSVLNKGKNIILPEGSTNVPLKDTNGLPMSGDEILMAMQRFTENYINQHHEAVPRIDPTFVAWLNQYAKMRSEGKSSDEIIKLTVSRSF